MKVNSDAFERKNDAEFKGEKKKTKTKKTSDELRKGEGLDSLGKGSRETLKKI